MLPEITQLLQLQERDVRLRGLQKDIKDVPLLQQRAKLQLAGDQGAVDAALQKTRDVEVRIKAVELDVQTRNTTIKRLQDQQFETRKNDEFQALGHEIQRYQDEVRSLEDKELEHMEELDAAKKELHAAQAKLAETQKHVNDDLKQLDERAVNLQKRLEETKVERTGLAAPVPAAALELYERLLKTKGGTAVVPLENGICGGCHMKVVQNTLQKLKQDETITQCEMCGRVLYSGG
ncbi:MAG: hypothetical protein K1X78_23480 [Verrucomicrobiaceae bacterium]|nr:hypothetical protein [Verrucomicrobiaceae bacterium]